MKENAILVEMNKMCEQSLDPSLFEKWEEVKAALYHNRQALHITWEFVAWAEKATGEAQIQGVDNKGNTFEATGIMGGGEIVEIYDIKQGQLLPIDSVSLPKFEIGQTLKRKSKYSNASIKIEVREIENTKNGYRYTSKNGVWYYEKELLAY